MATQTIQKPKEEIIAKLREVHDRLKAEGKIGVVAEPAAASQTPEASTASADSMTLEDIRADIVLIKEKIGFQRYMQALTSIDARDQEYIAALNDLSSMKPTDDMAEIRAKYARFRAAADALLGPAQEAEAPEPAPIEPPAPDVPAEAVQSVPQEVPETPIPVAPAPVNADASVARAPEDSAPISSPASIAGGQPLVLDADGNVAGSEKKDDATKVVLFNTPTEETIEPAPAMEEKTDLQKAAEALMTEPATEVPAPAVSTAPAEPLPNPDVPPTPVFSEPPMPEISTAPIAPPPPPTPLSGGIDQYREVIDDAPKTAIPPTPPTPRVINDAYREAIDAIAEEEAPVPALPEIPPPPPPAPQEPPISEQVGFGGVPPEAPDLPPPPPMPETGAQPQSMVQEAQSIMAASDPRMRPEVTQGLEQLLSEWDIFASSGFLGFGSGGVEHPIYKKIRGLPIAAVMAGRWDGSNEKVIQNIKMYIDGWRKERGVEALPEEKFEDYLRRVVARILQG
jgi:hypothetical protein